MELEVSHILLLAELLVEGRGSDRPASEYGAALVTSCIARLLPNHADARTDVIKLRPNLLLTWVIYMLLTWFFYPWILNMPRLPAVFGLNPMSMEAESLGMLGWWCLIFLLSPFALFL